MTPVRPQPLRDPDGYLVVLAGPSATDRAEPAAAHVSSRWAATAWQ